jgi:hypothetical protein
VIEFPIFLFGACILATFWACWQPRCMRDLDDADALSGMSVAQFAECGGTLSASSSCFTQSEMEVYHARYHLSRWCGRRCHGHPLAVWPALISRREEIKS